MAARKINHPFVSAKADGSDATQVQPSNWNADHSLTFGPSFSANRITSTQPLANNTLTELVFNATEHNLGTPYSTANGRFTPQVAGYYSVSACVQLQSDNLDISTASLFLHKNGTVIKNGSAMVVTAGFPSLTRLVLPAAMVPMNGSTDYLSLFGIVIRTTGPSYMAFGANVSWFEARWVQPL